MEIGKAGKVHLNPCTVSEKSEKGLEGVVGKVHLNPTLIHKRKGKSGEGSLRILVHCHERVLV